MTNEERKKKIVEIISPYVVERWHDKIADALIEAWIGDVSSEKAMRELAEAFHREKCAEYDLLNYQMQKSEYRVVEAEHRAEVAERALDKATELAYEYRTEADTLSCSSCPMFHIFDSCKERGLYKDCSKRWKEELIQQAEKELAEEKKDVE